MKKEFQVLLTLTVIFLCTLPFFYLHQGLLLIDTGREFYIPQSMLNGGVLFKDIFNIYGALSYQINAFLFMLFGAEISTPAIAGCINSFVIIITFYLISREFLNKTLSFSSALVIMYALVFPVFLYNSNLPYCFAVVYALSSFLLSLLFLIKYTKNKNPIYAYLSCFFAGVSFACKYEFLLYSAVLIYALRSSGAKNGLKAFLCLVSAPALSIAVLFMQGLNFEDIKNSAELIYNLITAPILKKFFFSINISVFQEGFAAVFAPLVIINAVLFLLDIKEIKKNEPLFIFLLSAFAAAPKSFLCLNINHMGVFLFPVIFSAFIILAERKYGSRLLNLMLILCIMIFAAQDFAALNSRSFMLETPKGILYTYKKDGRIIKHASDYIIKNTRPEDTVLVLPEGGIINFITDRKSDNTYYNLSPLFYYDVFGAERILNHFRENLPEYIVLLPIDSSEYGYKYFGRDYAQDFYSMMLENYEITLETAELQIFKRRKPL